MFPAKVLCSVSIFPGIFCIVAVKVLLCLGYNAHLILSVVKPCHGQITAILNNVEHYTFFAINDVTFIDLCQFMLSSLCKTPNNLSKDHFRETRKCLGSLCIQQPNQPQIDNVTKDGEEGEAMHVNEDYQNYRYKLPIVTQINNNKWKKTWC